MSAASRLLAAGALAAAVVAGAVTAPRPPQARTADRPRVRAGITMVDVLRAVGQPFRRMGGSVHVLRERSWW